MNYLKNLKFNHLLFIVIISSTFFVIFFPQFYTTTDEKEYLENSYLITQGQLLKHDKECYEGAYCGYYNTKGFVSKYNLGLSIIFIPLVLVNWKLTFIFTFIIYLVGIYVFKKILDFYKLNNIFLYIYAFYPSLVYYSIKPMSEVYSASLTLFIFYLYLILSRKLNLNKDSIINKRNLFYNVLFGISGGILVLIRYSNALILFIILIYYLGNLVLIGKLNIKKLLQIFLSILLGALPFILLFLIINKIYYGSFFKSGYSLSAEEGLIILNLIPKQTILYLIILNIIYPGMIVFSLFTKFKEKFLISIIFIIIFCFYVGFPGYSFTSGILDLVFGVRFFLPIIGLILLLYSIVLTKLSTYLSKVLLIINNLFLLKYFKKFITTTIIFFLIIISIIIRFEYYKRVNQLAIESNKIYLNTKSEGIYKSDNIEERKLINEAFKKGKIYFMYIRK